MGKNSEKRTDKEITDDMVMRFGFSPDEIPDAWRINAAITKAVTEALKERK